MALAALGRGHPRREGLQLLERVHAEVAEPGRSGRAARRRWRGRRTGPGGWASWSAPKSTASELSLQLGVSSRVTTRRASLAVSSTSKRGHGRPCRAAKCWRNPTSNGALWATSTHPRANSRNWGSTCSIGGATATIASVMPVSTAMNGRDGLVRVDQRLELAEHLAAAHLDRADLGDHRAALGRAAGRLQVDDAERHVAQRTAELVEAALRLPPRAAGPARREAAVAGHDSDARCGHRPNRIATRHTLDCSPGRAPSTAREGSRRGGGTTTWLLRSPTRPPAGAAAVAATSPASTSSGPARTTEFWHFDLAGDHRVEDATTDHEEVAAVTCRWCGRSDAVELVSRAEADASTP